MRCSSCGHDNPDDGTCPKIGGNKRLERIRVPLRDRWDCPGGSVGRGLGM